MCPETPGQITRTYRRCLRIRAGDEFVTLAGGNLESDLVATQVTGDSSHSRSSPCTLPPLFTHVKATIIDVLFAICSECTSTSRWLRLSST